MFHWSNHSHKIVLSDEEELCLVRRFSETTADAAKYNFCEKTRRRTERKITSYLEQFSSEEPDSFNRTYCFRSCYGDKAVELLPTILDGYARATKRAVLGDFGEPPEKTDIALGVLLSTSEPPFLITLLVRGPWPRSKPRISGRLFIPPSSVEKIAGTIEDFMIATTNMQVKFHRDFIRIWHKPQRIDEQGVAAEPDRAGG